MMKKITLFSLPATILRLQNARRWLQLPFAISILTFFLIGQRVPSSAFGQVNIASNAIEAANEHYYERRYAEAIQAYKALLEAPLQQDEKGNIRIRLGVSYMKRALDADAKNIFKEMIDENPNSSYAIQAMHRLAALYWQRYQFKEAILQSKQILKQYPGTSVASTAAYLIAQYEDALNNYKAAVDAYRYFLDNFPNSPYRSSAKDALIELYTQNKDYATAEKLIKARMETNPNDSTVVEKLGVLYQRQGEHAKALALYRNALKQNNTNTNLRKKLGALYAELGKTKQAVAEWKKLVNRETDIAERHRQLGMLYLSHKMYPEAIVSYRQAIRIEPKNSYLYIQLASVYKVQGLLEDAAMVYVEALQKVGMEHNQREAILFAMQDIYQPETDTAVNKAPKNPIMAKLIAHIEKQRREQPRNVNLTLTLAELLFHDGQPQDALETFRQLHQNYPTYTEIALDRYATFLERSEHPAATDFYKTLTQISTHEGRNRQAKRKLTQIFQKMEKWDEAVELLNGKDNTTLPLSDAIQTQIRLGQMQLRGLRAPKAAEITFQRLLTYRLNTSQLIKIEFGIAECHLLLKRYSLAQEILERIASGDNKFRATAHKLLGDSYFYANDFDKADEEYRQVILISKSEEITNDVLERIVLIQTHPDYFKIPLTDYATVLQLYLSGETDAAIQQCKQTFETHPQALIIDDIWLLLGNIYRNIRKDTESLDAYEQVVVMHSARAAEALIAIAEIYQRQGDFDNAISAYTTLITNYPENVMTVYARQQLDEITRLQQKNNSE